KACVLPENPASYRVVRTKSYLFNKAGKKLSAVVVNWLPSPGGTRRRIAKPHPNTELTGDNYEGFCPSTYREPGDPPELVRGETTPAVLLTGAERKP
ncbi:hypothetical protein, partial [Klebsiella pneumoniae]|uniref:hypothetical protein n=1 Tax=Klebsiella pneumoniae TaxID=573 RepID=UPI002231E3CE